MEEFIQNKINNLKERYRKKINLCTKTKEKLIEEIEYLESLKLEYLATKEYKNEI